MAISKKNRRTINYNGENYLWWVAPDFDYDGAGMLRVSMASENKKFLINHFIAQYDPNKAHITIIGEYFPGLERNGNHMKLSCPSFTDALNNKAVTLKTVKAILDWCFKTKNREVNQKP